MMGRAALHLAGCTCPDCSGGRDRHQQRRREERDWRRDQDGPEDLNPTSSEQAER
jgi:hypothetical protein